MDEIDISDHLKNFKEHLDVPENLRIVVSGAFGSGKTYFLNRFFINDVDYNVIKLFPVNYSVASNEDIFELIKFDILFELLINPLISFNKEYFSKFLTEQVFIQQNAFDILEPLISRIPKIGKATTEIAKKLTSFGEKFEKFHKSVQKDDEKTAADFVKKIKNKIAAVEEDTITELIRTSVESLSQDDKKTVLLIDDLDRIDPGHIFRILNVFSSHFNEAENKFFFDKVILVCDIDNIRGIFHARYGSKIDFSGYIDKFYSRKIFRFNNNVNVRKSIQDVTGSMTFSGDYRNQFGRRGIPILNRFLNSLLHDLLSIRVINLRKLAVLKGYTFNFELKTGLILPNQNIIIADHPIIAIIQLLIDLLGSIKVLKEALFELNNVGTLFNVNSDSFVRIILPLLDIEANKLTTNKIHSYVDPGGSGVFYYKLINNENGIYFSEVDSEVVEYRRNLTDVTLSINIPKSLIELIDKLENNHIF